MAVYNFEQSLVRIDEILNSTLPTDYLMAIPQSNDIVTNLVNNVYGTAVVVSYGIESQNGIETNLKDDCKIMLSLVSEAMAIGRSNPNCRDIIVTGKTITFIYSTPLKSDLNKVISDVAKIRTLSLIISRKTNCKHMAGVNISIGVDYGRISQLQVERTIDGYKRCAWVGSPIENAETFSKDEHHQIKISEIIWKNLPESNQNLFIVNNEDKTYQGAVINIMMNNWLTK